MTSSPSPAAPVPAGPDEPAADGLPIGPSVTRLRAEALRFLRGFGLLSATWSVLLALAAPRVERPGWLWAAVGLHVGWAVASLLVTDARAWWGGWFVLAVGLEVAVALAGTHGWSVTGGAVILVLAGVALSGRRRWVVATVATLVTVVVVRAIVAPAWGLADAVATGLVFSFGAVGLSWMVRRIAAVVTERDALQARLADARTAAARATERAEAGARLHDTVLQHLTAVSHATAVDEARRHAGRAANDLRQFLRGTGSGTTSLRALVQEEATRAADGVAVSVSVVGDRPVGERERLLVAAMAEGVRNAVAHGRPPVRVHAEVAAGDDAIVWVADHGDGFDEADVAADRLGVRESIRARMARAGGRAELAVGDTTEWELRLPG